MMSAPGLSELHDALRQAPVMGEVHPLVPLCLPPDTVIIRDAGEFAREMDGLSPHRVRSVLVVEHAEQYEQRFLRIDVKTPPSPSEINIALPKRLSYARGELLTNQEVADYVASEAKQRGYQAVVLVLVDGLSYDDVMNWPEWKLPCFIDGPTITYARSEDAKVLEGVGFPAIVGDPPLVRRLDRIGLHHARGFSYWDREENDVTALLFRGIPLQRVASINDALSALDQSDARGLYVQIVREGLDGLAHRRREVASSEIDTTIGAIRSDMRQLVDMLQRQGLYGAIYLVSDHGILWKTQHELELISAPDRGTVRYGQQATSDDRSSAFPIGNHVFHVYHYPYIGRRVPSNDSGVHGGLSYHESIVPLVRIEVTP